MAHRASFRAPLMAAVAALVVDTGNAASHGCAARLIEDYSADGQLHRSEAERLSAHLATASRLTDRGQRRLAAHALDRFTRAAEEVDGETARTETLQVASDLKSQLTEEA